MPYAPLLSAVCQEHTSCFASNTPRLSPYQTTYAPTRTVYNARPASKSLRPPQILSPSCYNLTTHSLISTNYPTIHPTRRPTSPNQKRSAQVLLQHGENSTHSVRTRVCQSDHRTIVHTLLYRQRGQNEERHHNGHLILRVRWTRTPACALEMREST